MKGTAERHLLVCSLALQGSGQLVTRTVQPEGWWGLVIWRFAARDTLSRPTTAGVRFPVKNNRTLLGSIADVVEIVEQLYAAHSLERRDPKAPRKAKVSDRKTGSGNYRNFYAGLQLRATSSTEKSDERW